ncbi:MAG TPA: DevR family CRISPR-associated autoregulator [Calditerricola sp.]|uniref:CRISPR-associated protein DevR n=1 Tax=Calditerricola satsumensis TaxID=373054 RepID=A0A8J3BG59_9BACI|nr:DevR family CRISPR-associated autoregulator [Calditerricola satsumensis]GGK05275.1 CRISPR-associated protein DevR [Calditerricola satsumensis]
MNIRSLSISGLITLDMHALNNEGAEGNHLHTRMVHITTETGELAVVNAISGDMLKHIQAEHLYHVAREKGLPLCGGCQTFDANRINADEAFFAELGKTKDLAEITNRVLERCVIDDIEGVLITRGERSVPRKSLVEFGWLVGVPERTRTEQYFHVKYDTGRRAGSGDESGANTGQNIFYRPASSGQYAVVLHVELGRVGYNDVTRTYALPADERKARAQALLESVLFTFVHPRGAQRNTQNPHILGFEGVLTTSTASVPAPTISALSSDYRREIEGIAEQLNRLYPGAVATRAFASLSEFAAHMAELIETLDVEA